MLGVPSATRSIATESARVGFDPLTRDANEEDENVGCKGLTAGSRGRKDDDDDEQEDERRDGSVVVERIETEEEDENVGVDDEDEDNDEDDDEDEAEVVSLDSM